MTDDDRKWARDAARAAVLSQWEPQIAIIERLALDAMERGRRGGIEEAASLCQRVISDPTTAVPFMVRALASSPPAPVEPRPEPGVLTAAAHKAVVEALMANQRLLDRLALGTYPGPTPEGAPTALALTPGGTAVVTEARMNPPPPTEALRDLMRSPAETPASEDPSPAALAAVDDYRERTHPIPVGMDRDEAERRALARALDRFAAPRIVERDAAIRARVRVPAFSEAVKAIELLRAAVSWWERWAQESFDGGDGAEEEFKVLNECRVFLAPHPEAPPPAETPATCPDCRGIGVKTK